MNWLLLATTACALLIINVDAENTSYRLPKSFRPDNYKLQVITHLNDEKGFKFFGKVWIKLICDENSQNITLHSKNLTINQKKISLKTIGSSEETKLDIENIEFVDEHDFIVIHSKQELINGTTYELYIPFEDDLNTGLLGYYKSSYFDRKANEKVWLSVTQFEPTAARRAFPCFDEPEFKATFDISLGHHKKYTALSNMPVAKTEQLTGSADDWVIDYFDRTVPMSTYLVAYTINDFEYKEATVKMSEDIVFRIWARRDAIGQVDYAKDVGPKVLRFYEEYFDEKFPLPKIDMIAIPDFSAGAMENWGLITYRETALLFQPNVSSSSSQHRVASVIAHELAHQWFGNLVTMKWWTDLWLNEGFATYVASLGLNYIHPEWNSLREESVDNTLDIFKFDSLKSSHPVSVTIGHPNQISQIFDSISYDKGSTILRMMHLFLGEKSFREGVSAYLKKHRYGNAEQDDLWESLTKAAHTNKALPETITVKQIMSSWTLQTGYPVVTVTRDYEQKTAELTEVRFLSDRNRARSELVGVCWWVPLSYTDGHHLSFNDTHARDWLRCNEEGEAEVTVLKNVAENDTWAIFNLQLAGLYKVKYDNQNWKLLIKTLISPDYKNIHTINRAQLIDDAMDLAWTGDQKYGIALSVINYLAQEKEYIPWKAALSNLGSINRLLKHTHLYGVFKAYIQHILEPIYKKVDGLNPQPNTKGRLDAIKLKVLIVSWACRFNVDDCVEKSVTLFRNWMGVNDPDAENAIPIDLRSVVYCNAMREGKEKEWNFLWDRYKNSNVGSEKTMIISALGCSKEIWLLNRYLDWSLNSTSGVRKQDSTFVFSGVARGDIGFHLAKTFFFDKIDIIYEYLLPDTKRITRFIKPLAEQMMSKKDLREIKELVDSHPKAFVDASQGVKQAIETVEINSQWISENFQEIARTLGIINYRNINGIDLELIES